VGCSRPPTPFREVFAGRQGRRFSRRVILGELIAQRHVAFLRVRLLFGVVEATYFFFFLLCVCLSSRSLKSSQRQRCWLRGLDALFLYVDVVFYFYLHPSALVCVSVCVFAWRVDLCLLCRRRVGTPPAEPFPAVSVRRSVLFFFRSSCVLCATDTTTCVCWALEGNAAWPTRCFFFSLSLRLNTPQRVNVHLSVHIYTKTHTHTYLCLYPRQETIFGALR
jgi:hypothetical protein